MSGLDDGQKKDSQRVKKSELVVVEKQPLKSYTSWGVGGLADYFAMPRTTEDVVAAIEYAADRSLPITILGGGTNVLISDRGIRGLTICLRKLSAIESAKESKHRFELQCLSGTSKSELLKVFLKKKLNPALFLAGLPGDVGGGVVMNAGVGELIRPREFQEITDWIEVVHWDDEAKSVKQVRLNSDQLTWSYRHCSGWPKGVITRVGLSWPLDPVEDLIATVRAANQNRLNKQPLDMPSCGSVFVNPEGFKSGRLIEEAGLKGASIGGAKVSEKHANFIVNFRSATAQDIHELIESVRKRVFEHSGVTLRTEVVYLGDWSF